MSGDLHQLYQAVILDHGKRPRNCRAIERGYRAEGHNPLCGDRITVYVRMDAGIVEDVSFERSGCAILTASASLMTEAVQGLPHAEAMALAERVCQTITAPPGAPLEEIGALAALAGVRLFPTRVKCATLPWRALQAAVKNPESGIVSTE